MQKALILTGIIVGLAGCQQPSSSTNAQAKPADAPIISPTTMATQGPVKFEVRDFKLNERKESYGTAIHGQGILISKDEGLKKGNFMVWLSVKQAHKNDERWKTLIVLRDGIGTIESHDFLSREDREKNKVKYFDWEIIGFVKLQEGVISSDEPPAAAK